MGKVLEARQDSDTPILIKILRMEGVKAGVGFAPVRILRQDVIISAVMRAGTQTITRFARAIPIQVVAGE